MGIPIYPGPDFSDSCRGCFPPNETPDVVVASVSGVVRRPGIAPFYPRPPNGQYILYDTGDCAWVGQGPSPWSGIWWAKANGGSVFVCQWGAEHNGFQGSEADCATFFTNELNPLYFNYYYGNADIMCTKTYSPVSESQHIAGLLGLPIDKYTKYDFWPVSATERCIRFARMQKQFNILLKIAR